MPNRKISQLQANANLTVSDIFPIVNSGTTKKQDIQGLLNFLTPYFSGNTELYITGGTYSAGTAVFTNSTGGTFSVSGFSTGSSFTGGTVSGATRFTNGLTASTISATTYQNLPSFTGGTVSGATRFTNGLTATTISATTYQNLPLDIRVTGGTYDENSRVATFTNNTGGTFEVSGFYKPLWYAEPSSAPSASPIVAGTNSIAIGDGANASAEHMFVVGNSAGFETIGSAYSNFIGKDAGVAANGSAYSNFIGAGAGGAANGSTFSNFIGTAAGRDAGESYYSNFIGREAGDGSNGSNQSNFIGYQAGYRATNARNSNFLGNSAGIRTETAEYCNFIGYEVASGATKTRYSTFIGYQAGYNTNSDYSIIIGHKAGLNSAGSVSNNNIIIGTNITLPPNAKRQINIGGILFGANTYNNTETEPVYSARTDGAIGINVVEPRANLHIGPSTTDQALMRLEVGPAPSSPNDGDIWLESNTLTGLKIRISGATRTITIT